MKRYAQRYRWLGFEFAGLPKFHRLIRWIRRDPRTFPHCGCFLFLLRHRVAARGGSLRPVAPGLGAAAVLQIAAGQSAALGIKPGDTVKNKIFGNGG